MCARNLENHGGKKTSAFSLAEAVLALGILSVSLVAILGLLANSLGSDRQSSVDTALGMMTQTVIALIHSQGYSAVNGNSYYTDATPDNYFDAQAQLIRKPSDGTPLTEADTSTPPVDAVYSCTVTKIAPPANTPANFVFVQLDFAWSPSHPQHKIAITSVAEYDDASVSAP